MKKLIISIMALSLMLCACNKDDSNEIAPSDFQSQFIDSLETENGIVQYDKDVSAWTITVYKNGTLDNVCIYFPKSLNKEFQENGLSVFVSGCVYELTDTFLVNISARENIKYYALSVTNVSIDSVKANELIGTWYLSRADYNFGGIKTFASNKIVYNFYNNGILTVQDMREEKGNVPFLNIGAHKYNLEKETCALSVDASTYGFVIENDTLTIDTGSAWDAPIYVFQKGM